MARRNNPESAGFYIALAAAGVALYFVLRPAAAVATNKPPTDTPPPPPPPPPPQQPPTKGCHGLPFMPKDKARQLQTNLNAFFDKAQIALCVVDGYFGPNTAQMLDFYRGELSRIAESARGRSGNFTVLKDATIFYDPTPSDTVTFDLYQRGCDLPAFTMRKSLYDKLTSSAFTWSTDDISRAGLTPAVAG
jgi:hypothetical protein